MPNQHKHSPIPFRPPEGDRSRLLAYAERTGQPVNRILADALAAYLDAVAKERRRRQNAEERIALARHALLADGYFTEDQVGDDIAPRIIERLAAMRETTATCEKN